MLSKINDVMNIGDKNSIIYNFPFKTLRSTQLQHTDINHGVIVTVMAPFVTFMMLIYLFLLIIYALCVINYCLN